MIWWKKAVLSLCLFALWFCGLIVVGGKGYPSQYFWLSGSAFSICLAVAPLWRFRASVWYWSTVAFLIATNLATIYFARDYISNPDLPAKGVVQGLGVLDCMASWVVMVGVCYLVKGQFPWRVTDE